MLTNQEIDFSNIVFTTKQERKTAHTKKPQSAGKYSYWAEWVDVTAYNLEDIEWFDPDSSSVAMFGYDESEKYLYIQFKSNKNIVYCYYDFQRWAFFEFLNAESKGRYVYYEIIKKYKCVKMEVSTMSPEWKRNIKKI